MKEDFLDQKEIREIVVFTFFLVQMTAKIDQLLFRVLSKVMWADVQEVLELTFNQKVDAIYKVLEKSLNREGWKDLELGKDSTVFTPKLLKSVLIDLSKIRNRFAHVPVFYDEINGGVSDLGPGIIKLFLNFGEVEPKDFPLKLKFNEKLLERDALKISMGSIFGLEADQFLYKYTKKDTKFKIYTDLFKYVEVLSQYAFQALTRLEEILIELMAMQEKGKNSSDEK